MFFGQNGASNYIQAVQRNAQDLLTLYERARHSFRPDRPLEEYVQQEKAKVAQLKKFTEPNYTM